MKKVDKSVALAAAVKPDARQIAYQQTEFNALLCYGMPPFTGVQYGNGFTPASQFWPEDFDAEAIAETVKLAGMTGIILVCKHYDGFCLWPTKMTDYSVASSNWRDGSGDLVAEVSDACRAKGLKFGVSVAPWDVHEETYGEGKAYDEFFMGLLRELLTDYGDIFCVRLDAVCGAEKPQDYDWEAYYKLIRELAPDAVISFAGPDVRWGGNNRGVTRRAEWSAIPAAYGVEYDGDKSADIMDLDLGSRKAIAGQSEFIWYPCEVSVPMRANWFFTPEDKYTSRTKDKLLDLYIRTVGANSNLLLGICPDKHGRLDEVDSTILKSLGSDLQLFYGYNLLGENTREVVSSSVQSDLFGPENVRSDDMTTAWRPAEGDKAPWIEIRFREPETFDRVVLKELIADGEHVEAFEVYALNDKGKMKKIAEAGNVGHKRIVHFKPCRTSAVRIVITEWRQFFELEYILLN